MIQAASETSKAALQLCTIYGASHRVMAENCRVLASLVHRLGEAINEKKRMEADTSHSAEDRMQIDREMTETLNAMRLHKAEHGCVMEKDDSSSAA